MDEPFTTMVEGELLSKIVLSICCERCHAKAGQPCRKRDGESFVEGLPIRVHVHRITIVWVIFEIGRHQGRREMKEKEHGEHHHQDQDV